jgi:hypothetical protein
VIRFGAVSNAAADGLGPFAEADAAPSARLLLEAQVEACAASKNSMAMTVSTLVTISRAWRAALRLMLT